MSTFRVGKVKYYTDQIIGRGSFGTVYSGILRGGIYGGDARPIAVKRIERGRVDECLIQREVELMQKANGHPNILSYFCTETDTNFVYGIFLNAIAKVLIVIHVYYYIFM